MASRRAPIAGRTLAGRYELRDRIGTGGMATVHRAWDTRLGREVAVKRLVPSLALDPVVRHRFEAEANAAARISHPNVVTVFDTNERDGEPFIVMECLSGATLAGELARGRLPIGRVREIAVDVLSGLAAAHDLDVVHRDIKPSNLLVAADGSIKIADFGIAKSLASLDHTATGDVVGSAAYIAPERLEGHSATARSDLYSLGVVLYESATGRKPFTGDTPAAVAHAVIAGHAQPLREARPDIDEELATAIERAMARRPEDRFATARDMTAGLRRPELEDTMAISAVDLFGEPTEAVAVTRTAAIPDSGSTSRQIVPVEPGEHAPRRRTWGTFVFAAAVVAVILLGALVFLAARSNPTPAANTPTTSTPAPAPHGANPAPLPAQLQDGLQQLENAVRP